MSARGVVRVATCQFPVTANIQRNASHIIRQIQRAADLRADVVHFPECALSGYAGAHFKTWDGFDWEALRFETRQVCRHARDRKVWVVLGSSHRLSRKHLPHNSLYVVDSRGRVADRYDKRFCTKQDLKYFTPGRHFSVFQVNGVRCGLSICYEVRFPEVYREYKKRRVQCVFHAFHNADKEARNIHTIIMRPSLQARAASNYIWISATNSSAHYQSWPSIFVRPDGEIAASLKFHRAGIMVNEVDTRLKLYDASAAHRDRALKGILHSGRLVRDGRSKNRRAF